MKKKILMLNAIMFSCGISIQVCLAQCINQNEIKTTDWAETKQTNNTNFPSLPDIINTFDWTRPYYDGDVYKEFLYRSYILFNKDT